MGGRGPSSGRAERVWGGREVCGEKGGLGGGRTALKEFIVIVSQRIHHTWTKAVSVIFTGKVRFVVLWWHRPRHQGSRPVLFIYFSFDALNG